VVVEVVVNKPLLEVVGGLAEAAVLVGIEQELDYQ
jgi:hypothetical protein